MGRWDSDIYEMYLRHSLDGARRTGTVIASTAFEDFEGMFDHEEWCVSASWGLSPATGRAALPAVGLVATYTCRLAKVLLGFQRAAVVWQTTGVW